MKKQQQQQTIQQYPITVCRLDRPIKPVHLPCSATLSDKLKPVQRRALKIVFPQLSYMCRAALQQQQQQQQQQGEEEEEYNKSLFQEGNSLSQWLICHEALNSRNELSNRCST